MKKSLRMKIMLLLFALVVGISNVRATDYSYNFSSGGTHNSSASPKTNTWTTDYFTLFQQRGSNTASAPANYLTAPRWYQNNTVTVTPAANVTITQIVIAYSGSYTGGTISYPTSQSLTHDSQKKTQTWSGSITSSTPLVLTMGAQCRPTTFAIVYSTSGGDDPTITVTGTLKDFAFATNDGPSMPQSITVSGSNLDEDISLGLGNNSQFEISLSANSGWDSSIVLEETDGTVSETTIYVRMKNANSTGNPSGTISLESGTASESVDLTGHVVTPLTVAQARTAIDQANNHNVSGAYVKGIVSTVKKYESNYINYFISDDGTATNELEAYHGKNFYNTNFTSINDVKVGDVVLIYGDMTLYNSSVYEFTDGNYLLTHKTIRASETELEDFTYIAGSGPSDAQSFTVDGANLTADLTLSLGENSDFEISQSENTGYTNTIALTPSNGTVSTTTIYARLKSGKSVGDYEGTIAITSTGANSPQIALSGSVTAQTYTIEQKTAPATAHGTINFTYEGALTEGKSVTLSTVPADGYEFTANSWKFYNKGTGSEVTNSISVTNNVITMPAYNLQVDATFSAKTTYTITSGVTPANSGTIATDEEAWEGKEVTVLVESEDGYAFSLLSITKTSDAGTTVEYSGNAAYGFTFTMPAYAVTVTATFVPVYHVSYIANIDGATGSTTDANDYEEGDKATVLACGFTKAGYAFSHWNTEDDDNGVSYDAGDKITIGTSDVTLYAQWVAVSSVKYTINSTSSVTVLDGDGTAPLGSIATFSQTYNTACQMTGGNSMTFTLSGCQGRTIKSIVLSMKSNKSAGAGTLSVVAGSTTLASIDDNGNGVSFSNSAWNGSYTQSYTNVTPAMTNDSYEIQAGENLVITIAATTSSLFCESFAITYATTTKDPVVFAVPSAQVVTNAEQEITTSDAKAFGIASLNIATPTYSIAYCDKDGNVLGSNPYSSWFTPSISSSKVVYSVEENTEETDRIAYFKVYATVSETNYYSALCSVTQKHQPFTYTLVDGSTITLEAGKRYIIASGGSGTVNVMGAQSGNYRSLVEDVSVTSNQITESDGMYEVVFSGDNTNYWTMYDVNYKSFICSTNSGGNITTSTNISNNTKWTVSISSGAATINAQAGDAYKFRYNSGSSRFAGYVQNSSIDGKVYLFKRDNDKDLEFYSPTTIASATIAADETYTVESGQVLEVTYALNNSNASNLIIEDGGQLITNNAVQATVQKNVTAYSSATGLGNTDGWHFIALPINSDEFTPTEAMLTGTYDLYRLDPTSNKWQNYKPSGDNENPNAAAGFKLENGRGYLYANDNGFTVDFAGEVKAAAATQDVTVYQGWNLIGNPFTYNVYVNRPYYKMNDAKKGVEIVESYTTNTIAPCTGVVVTATEASETVTFSKEAPVSSANHGNIQMALAQTVATRDSENTETIDNAIVSFNEGSELPKFYFGTQNANIYIPLDNEEYAIVSSNAQGEMPVNFRAYVAGEYTITVNPEEVEMGYLHLIDNIAGKDVDLLSTPSYTFNAKGDDYESRFRLVFSANMTNAEMGEDFAFISDGQLVIANEGEATLQVIDVTGRVVATENINGTCSKAINAKAGVYVLRLVNGTDVKTQKMVIR